MLGEDNHGAEVQFKVIHVFSSVNIAKTFWIKDFFENYSVKLTNNKKTSYQKKFVVALLKFGKKSFAKRSEYFYLCTINSFS